MQTVNGHRINFSLPNGGGGYGGESFTGTVSVNAITGDWNKGGKPLPSFSGGKSEVLNVVRVISSNAGMKGQSVSR